MIDYPFLNSHAIPVVKKISYLIFSLFLIKYFIQMPQGSKRIKAAAKNLFLAKPAENTE